MYCNCKIFDVVHVIFHVLKCISISFCPPDTQFCDFSVGKMDYIQEQSIFVLHPAVLHFLCIFLWIQDAVLDWHCFTWYIWLFLYFFHQCRLCGGFRTSLVEIYIIAHLWLSRLLFPLHFHLVIRMLMKWEIRNVALCLQFPFF